MPAVSEIELLGLVLVFLGLASCLTGYFRPSARGRLNTTENREKKEKQFLAECTISLEYEVCIWLTDVLSVVLLRNYDDEVIYFVSTHTLAE